MKSSSSYQLTWLLGLVVLQALALQFQISLCSGCLEQERTALLQIKASMEPSYHAFFGSWDSSDGGVGGCCSWHGVECDITTGKVIKLELHSASHEWSLNASLFLPFEDLTHLDLTFNHISSWVPNQGLERLSALSELQVLILDDNSFNNTILPSLGQLSSLRTLSLSRNSFEGSFDFGGLERLSALSELQVLILDLNGFNNTILPSLGQLSSLRTLSLYGNRFEGSFDFGGLHNMTNLYELNLDNNAINTIEGLGRLHALDKLEVLKLGSNHLNNSILPYLGLPSSLKVLSLDENEFTGSFDVRELSYMSNLEELDLSDNGITNVKGLESLSKLIVLTLSENRLGESHTILQSVGALRSLKILDMAWNQLKGFAFANSSSVYSNLLELDLTGNYLEGMIPSSLGNFTSLRYLDLSGNQFEGNLALSPVADLNALECLVISYNSLEIPVSLTSFFNHSQLKVLLTDNNRLLSDKVEFHLPRLVPKFQLRALSFSKCWSNNPITRLPDFFRHQSYLRFFDLSHINLALPFPSWLVENNTLLEQFNMRNNSLTGSFLFPSHRLFPKITAIDISDNSLAGQTLETIGRIFPRLITLNMSGILLGGPLPASIGKLKYLESLDLSNNHLSGVIPSFYWPSLEFLSLSHNSLSGQLSLSLYNLTSLEYLYLDDNQFVGEIPDFSPAISLQYLDLSNNHISGKIPRWIGNTTGLQSLALASNNLEGSFPVEFCNLNIGQYFEFLDLSDNDLSGSIPSCFSPPFMTHVHLNRNKLSGPMTRAFRNSSSLVMLDLIDNNLTGPIPSWIGELTKLSVVLLKLNNFDGTIPLQLCNLKSLSILDLSQNSLSGWLPHCLSNMPVQVLGKSLERSFGSYCGGLQDLYDQYPTRVTTSGYFDVYPCVNTIYRYPDQQVEFSTKFGSYSYKGSVLDLMSGIDLSCNHLTGEIPAEIGNLSNIHALNLSHNHLTGPIPTTFSNLTAVESLDLSYNNLNGRIPPQLVELVALETFSVAHNNLSGPVPEQKAQFGTFDERSYEGNPLLCGHPLPNSCSTKTGTGPANPQAPEKKAEHDDMVGFYASCVASYVTVLITIAAVLLINPRWRRAWFYYVEVGMTSSYYFVLDTICSVTNRRRMV